MERRRPPTRPSEKPTPLPPDYLRLVENVFSTNFEKELARIAGSGRAPVFKAGGGLFPNEVVLWVALVQPERMAATTVHSSSDFDLTDEGPEDAEARLAAGVDAIGVIFSELLAPEALSRLRIGSQATLDELPVGWSETKVRDRAIYMMVDSSNPDLEKMTEDWLSKNDPKASAGDDDELADDDEVSPEGADDDDDALPFEPPALDTARKTHKSSGGPAKRKKPPAIKH